MRSIDCVGCFAAAAVLSSAGVIFAAGASGERSSAFEQSRQDVLGKVEKAHGLDAKQMERMREIFNNGPYIGQGNPAVVQRPATIEQCHEKLKKEGVVYENPEFEKICGGRYMAPLYNPDKEKPSDAKACIDQFEFPDIPCEYPVVWVRTREAAEICTAMGKRLCDAHEWEGACEGRVLEPDYPFELAKNKAESPAVNAMRAAHNRKWAPTRSWSYGPDFKKGVCGQNSTKDGKCNGGQWGSCGSNHYPVGYFPGCTSQLKVYDINGNAAEHMNLPLKEDEMTSRGSSKLGVTEMKGSWFIWDKFQAHPDWCRWRAPYWHGSRVMDKESHHNYHLGFRCCKTVEPQKPEPAPASKP